MPPKRNSMGNKKSVTLPETVIIQHGAHEGSNISGEVHSLEIDQSNIPRTSRDIPEEIQQLNSKKTPNQTEKKSSFGEDIEKYSNMTAILAEQMDIIRGYSHTIQEFISKNCTTDKSQNNSKVLPANLENQSIIEDQTKIDRAIDRMLKSMPNFNGEPSDNFETWVLRVKIVLEYGEICSERQKLNAILTKVGGYAQQVIDNSIQVSTVEDLFKILRTTYGKDERTILSNIKQTAGESVKLFSVRLKNNLRL